MDQTSTIKNEPLSWNQIKEFMLMTAQMMRQAEECRQADYEKLKAEYARQQAERQAEYDRQQAEFDKQRAERQAEYDRRRAERQAEYDRQQADYEKLKAEYARQQAERQAEYERWQAERQAEYDRWQAERQAERQAEYDRQQAELKAEEKKRKAEEKKRKAEEKKRKAEEKKLKAEEKKRKAEEEKRKAEEEKRKAEYDAKVQKDVEELRQQMKETDRKIKEATTKYSSQMGHVIEGLMEPSALALFQQSGFDICKCWKGMKGKRKDLGLEMEVDLFLHDTTEAVVVEVKTNCRKDDVDHFVKQMGLFSKIFPEYAAVKVYLAMAAVNYDRESDQYAAEKGLFVIRVSEDAFTLDPAQKENMVYYCKGECVRDQQ